MSLSIVTFECLSDNYGFLLHDTETGATASVDAADAQTIIAQLERQNWNLTDIFITHHHWDHTDGIVPLKEKFNLTVTGPGAEADKVNGLDIGVRGGDTIKLGTKQFLIIDTPGHTNGHISFFESTTKSLFCGDALFSLGCGRMFEGTPEPMWNGLKSLRDLPDETLVYCGHEYSAGNAAFAVSIDPENIALQQRAKEIKQLRENGKPTIPFILGQDKQANPFLRADDPALAKRMGLAPNDPAEVFAAIRKAKDQF